VHQGQDGRGAGAGPLTRRRRLAGYLYGSAAALYVLDRVTKAVVEHTLAGRPPIEVIPGLVRFRFVDNPGGAFGLFGGQPVLFLVASAIAVVAVVVSSRHLVSLPSAIGLGLILGGAIGNVTDRVSRGPGIHGSVVDFIDFRVWPVFNVADMGIVIGAALVIIASFRHRA